METKEQSFERWFVAQFGTRTGPTLRYISDEGLEERIRIGKMAEAEKAKREAWDIKRDAALKGWCAK